MQNLKPLIHSLQNFAQKRLGFEQPPRLFLKHDEENAKNVFGKTAFYDPNEKAVTIFVTGRHPKDILRSLAHELVHHTQNLKGDLSSEKCGEMGIDYAQQNDYMREMERQAFEQGNLCFRDWEDGIKVAIQKENNRLKENKEMVKISKKELKGLISKILEAKIQEKGLPKQAQKNMDMLKSLNKDMLAASDEFKKDYEAGFSGKKKKSEPVKKAVKKENEELEEAEKATLKLYGTDIEGIEEAGCGSHKRDDDLEEGKQCCGTPGCGHPGDSALKENEELEEGKKCPHCDGDAPKSECICGKIKENEELEEGPMPMIDEPEGEDLNRDGKKGFGKVPAFLKNKQNESKIQTPEQEKALYESRYNVRNEAIFDTLKKLWTK